MGNVHQQMGALCRLPLTTPGTQLCIRRELNPFGSSQQSNQQRRNLHRIRAKPTIPPPNRP
eukprot:9586683-Prorocentrum_lima.AAC.1